MTERTALVAGNWKMNGLATALSELDAVARGASSATCELMIAPPATLLREAVARTAGNALGVAAQDCHAAVSGAHTGDISAEMIADAGCSAIIVGHSERRTDHGESDADVRTKAEAAWRAGLVAIVCIGETQAERESGATNDVLSRQIEGSVPEGGTAAKLVVAYEPVWAIGTGLTPSNDDIAAAHAHIRQCLRVRVGDEADAIRILYGGSVKPSNAGEILALEGVDGALVGGASLKADDFLAIAASA